MNIFNIHNKYDTLQKLALIHFAQEILRASGDTRKVVGFYPTELIIPTFQNKYMDGVLILDDGSLVNVEFQTGDLNEEFLIRCSQYAVNLRVVTGKIVDTIIISTGNREKSVESVFIGNNFKFNPKIIFYSEIDGALKLSNIKNKVKNNEKLGRDDYYDIVFIPLMGNVNKVDVAYELFNFVNEYEYFSYKDKSKIKELQYIIAIIVSDGDENLLKEYMEIITMFGTFLIEREKQLREEGIEEGIKEGIKEGIEEGMVKGRVEGYNECSFEIAAFLKSDGFDFEYVSKVTGVSVSDIEKL